MIGSPYIRFFAAYPIVTPDGHVLGAFAVFDSEPKYGFALTRRASLEGLARKAYKEFEILTRASTGSLGSHFVMAPFSDTPRTRSLLSSQTGSIRSPVSPASVSPVSENRHMLQYIVPRHQDVTIVENIGEAPSNTLAQLVGVCYGIPFFLPPSASTHPLLNKPQPRTEQRDDESTPSTPSTSRQAKGSFVGMARTRAMMMASTTSLSTRAVATKSIASTTSLLSPAEAYRRGLRTREELAIEFAAEPKYIQEWGFFLKCYCEV